MRYKSAPLIFFLLLFVLAHAFGQWTRANGPDGGRATTIADLNGKLFVGCQVGVFISEDSGVTWQQRSNGMVPYPWITSLSCDSSGNIYAGSAYWGLYISNNNGEYWQHVSSNVFDDVNSIVTAGNRVIVATSNGIYLSQDLAYWLQTYSGSGFGSLVFRNDTLFCSSSYGVRRSIDSGIHWTSTTFASYLHLELVNDTLYSVYDQKIYRSTTGSGWTLVTSITDGSLPREIAGKDENIYVTTLDSGVYVSHDYGNSFHRSPDGMPDVFAEDVIIAGGRVFSTVDGSGIYYSDDFGDHWDVSNNGFTAYESIYKLAKFGVDIFLASPAGLFFTHDEGNSWTEIDSGLPEKYIYSIAVKDSTIFAGTLDYHLYKSADYGKTWVPSGTGLGAQQDVRNIVITDDGLLYCNLGSTGVYVSYDNGDNWQLTTLSGYIFTMGTIGNKVIACTNSQIWATVDSGQTWTASSNGVTNKIFKSFQKYDSLLYITSDKVYYSTDKGANWSSLNAPGSDGYKGAWRVDSLVFALGYNNIYSGTSSGTDWKVINENIQLPVPGEQIIADDSNVFLARLDGIWKHHGFDFTCFPQLKFTYSDSTLCIGDTANFTFIDTCTGLVAANLSWNPSINTQATDSGFIAFPTQTTLYKITSTSGGLKDSAYIMIYIDNDCVWPGDFNDDGIADNRDILALGVLNSFVGPERDIYSYSWQDYYADDWFWNLPDSLNFKHTDGNGNGTINFLDTFAIKTNYLKTHNPHCSPVFISNPAVSIQFDFNDDTLYSNSYYSVPVTIGSDTSFAYFVYGTAFTINFDSVYLDKNSITFDFNDSWLAEYDSLLRFKKLRFSNGALDIAESRFDHHNITGNGIVGYLNFKVDSMAPAGTCIFSISNPQLDDAAYFFNQINVTSPDTIGIMPPVPTNVPSLAIFNTPVKVSPNPSSNTFIIYTSVLREGGEVLIYNLTGRLKESHYFRNSNVVVGENFSDGIYLVKIIVEGKLVEVMKLVKEH